MYLVSGCTATVRRIHDPDYLGILLTPKNFNAVSTVVNTGLCWAIDNGAYSGFDPCAFRGLLRRCARQPRLLWIVCPDVVACAKETIKLYEDWQDEVRQSGPVAFVLQDGQEDEELPEADAYFIGGSTRFKLSTAAADLAAEAKARGAWLHMGRVNSYRRLVHAFELRCDSVDGTSASRWGDRYIPKYMNWLRHIECQGLLFLGATDGIAGN